MTYQNVVLVQILYYFSYTAVITYGILRFYNELLTPRSWFRRPFRDTLSISLVLLLPMIYFSVRHRMFSSIYFLVIFFVIAVALFNDKLYIRISTYFFAVLSYIFIELVPSSFFFIANLFIKDIDLIPQYIINDGYVVLSLIYFLLIDLFFLRFILNLADTFRGRFATLPLSLVACLSLPFIVIAMTCNLMALCKNYFQFAVRCAIMLPLFIVALRLLLHGLDELKRQELYALSREAQEKQLKHRFEHYQYIEEKYVAYRKWKHDVINHLSIISFLIKQENYKDAENYLISYNNKVHKSEEDFHEI